MTTTFEAKCDILAEVWVQYKHDPEWGDFVEYNDLGLPLAYAISTEIVTSTPKAQILVNETFVLLLSALGVEDDAFESFDDLMIAVAQVELDDEEDEES
jgi:hypothetical protein